MRVNNIHLENLPALKAQFAATSPCKFVVIDDFLDADAADQLYAHFPAVDSLKVKRKSLNENKVEDYHFERWDPIFSEVRATIRSVAFGQWMSELTNIPDLVTPDNPLGSGLHQGGPGSYVDVHIDVNYDPATGLWRRINLLIYLNKHWKEDYGGHLEIWDPAMSACLHKIAPSFNRAVIFLTDENSPHGYAQIQIPEGESRKSFYAYFFTEIGEGFRYSDSKFVSRPDASWTRRTATASKEWVKINAKRVLKALGMKSLDFKDKNKSSKKNS